MNEFENGRQAVVLIHGMGNQYPMETLRSFVKNLSTEDQIIYSSPNRITEDLELRRLSFDDKPFDFYEYYWAHHVKVPGMADVLSWLFKLLFFKSPSNRLGKFVPILRGFVVLMSILIIWWLNHYEFKSQVTIFQVSIYGVGIYLLWKVILPLLKGIFSETVLQYLGDVVRYTIASPENIDTRDKIRKGALDLLRKLHDQKSSSNPNKAKYGRIVVVAHSLGSIVAYDVMASLFAEYNAVHGHITDTKILKQDALDENLKYIEKGNISSEKYMEHQLELFFEQNKLGNPWRISDFITIGSPLTHGSFLLTKNEEDFKLKKEQREFPTCPPVIDLKDKHFAFHSDYISESGAKRTLKVLHHAAYFAATRWTNIYFKNDFIGGPVSLNFGPGIKDIQVLAKNSFIKSIPLASHTHYWDKKNPESMDAIREIIYGKE
ncbi:MAG: hypothetical protein WAR77_14290 [Saprospiraceae bacterium]